MGAIDFTGIVAEPVDLTPCPTLCESDGCMGCSAAECPHGEPLHRHPDGCPSCEPFDSGEEPEVPDLLTRYWRDGEE